MRVLLMQPRYTFKSDVPLVVQIPLGLCYLAAVARKEGHDVAILDALAEGHKRRIVQGDFTTYGLSDEEISKRIREFKPDLVGVSALFSIQNGNAENLCRLTKSINPSIITVMGGIHATIRPEQVMGCEAVDFVLRGEADFTFTELLNALENKEDYRKIDGLCWKHERGLTVSEKSAYIDDLDSVPFPARDLVPLEAYWKAGLAHGFNIRGRRNFTVITSRGCPAPCTFCTISQVWGKRFRSRSSENVVAELQHLKRDFGANHIQFEDDNLTFDVPKAKDLFQKMISGDVTMPWNTPNGVAAWRMDTACLDLMKAAGCYYVTFAIESGNQEVLTNIIKKPQRLDDVVPLVRYARRIGLKVGAFFVVGFPGETRAQIQESFDFPHRVHFDWVEYAIATPYWGTELRKQALEDGYLDDSLGDELYARRGSLNTEEFTAEWLEQKVMQENWRYIKHMAIHQPIAMMSQGWEVLRANPSFVAKYVLRIFKDRNRQASTYDSYLPQHFDWSGR